MYSAQDRFEEAIEECHLAIEVDPDFGNPYNDIGCYLMELKEIDEAAEWFEKAKTAPRYEPRHFPYMNIARIHLTRAKYGQACGELYQALKRAPGEASLRTQLLELLSLLN
jgi:Tfp pilus assembly protein PilF